MSLRTSAWLLPQKEHIVRLEARAMMCALKEQFLFLDFARQSGLRDRRRIASDAAPSSSFTSLRDLITSSTRPYAFASAAVM